MTPTEGGGRRMNPGQDDKTEILGEMNRRSFFSFLSKAAAVTFTPSLLGAAPLPPSAKNRGRRQAQITNGSSSLQFVKGPSGLGLELSIRRGRGWRRVASVQSPVRVFYDRRGNGSEVDAAFTSARSVDGGLAASTILTDSRNNRWSVKLHVDRWKDEGFRCHFNYKLLQGEARNVFFEHGMVPALAASPNETYVLMPGLLYDGNRLARPNGEIPRLNANDHFQLDTPALSLSTTATLLYEKATGATLVTKTEVESGLGPSGFSYEMRPQQHKLAVMAPLYREKHYRGHPRFYYQDVIPAGANVAQGRHFDVTVFYLPARYASLAEFFSAFHAIREPAPFVRRPQLPMSKAAELVETNFNTIDWCKDHFYINASNPDYTPQQGCETLDPGWQLIVGWCAGVITGYALLKAGNEESRQRSRAMLDLIAQGGLSPSGLFWSNYSNGKWDKGNTKIAMHQHMRMPGDGTFFFLKSIALERSRGREHPEWTRAAASNLDAFVKLWRKNRDFGHFVNRVTLEIEETGSAAGALCIGCLALAASLGFPNGKDYLAVAKEGADAYYQRYVETGWLAGGPLDIGIAADSESTLAILESFVTLYETARDPKYLRYAQMAADILASWVISYNAPFPPGTDCARVGIQTVGGVLANSRNHHIGPTVATSSGDAFFRLYRYTGQAVYLKVLQDIVSGLPQYLCYKPGQYREIKSGMMSEQYNMSDELGSRGYIWQVNASWPITGLLLSYGALPSIYVDRPRRNLAVFDQLDVKADFDAQNLSIRNATPYEAHISVGSETEHRTKITLAPDQMRTLSLKTLDA